MPSTAPAPVDVQLSPDVRIKAALELLAGGRPWPQGIQRSEYESNRADVYSTAWCSLAGYVEGLVGRDELTPARLADGIEFAVGRAVEAEQDALRRWEVSA